MNWIDRLDRKIGKYAPKNLIYYILGMYVIGYVLYLFNPIFYSNWLCLDIEQILQGQIWRIITWLMYPSGSSIIWFLLSLYMYYWIGKILETEWGAFQFDLYYVCGILMHVFVCLIFYIITGTSYIVTPEYLNLSMFMVYALLFPDRMVLWFFIIPLKSKWLAIVDLLYFAIAMIQGIWHLSIVGSTTTVAASYYYIREGIAAFASLLIFAIFYFSGKTAFRPSIKDRKRKKDFEKKAKVVIINNPNRPKHHCEVCGRTDISDPDLEFRYCSKCEGVHEYCMDHLYTHEHKHE